MWETQLESYRVHQATLSEHAVRARAEIETSRRILKEVSDNTVKEGNLSIPQPIQEETEDAGLENAVDSEELRLRDQLQGVLNACAGSLGLQVAAPEQPVHEVSDEDKEQPPQHKRPRSVDPAKTGQMKQWRKAVSFQFVRMVLSRGRTVHVSNWPFSDVGKGLF